MYLFKAEYQNDCIRRQQNPVMEDNVKEAEKIEEVEERIIPVGVATSEKDGTEESLDELEELAKTAGAVTVAKVIQNRMAIHPGTYIGKGKVAEIKELIWELDATGVVCDDELSPAQLNNLEQELDTKVIDRTIMILDIFAKHAITKEGKIQVELAQLRYRASRLTGLGRSLSRLGGGIGTRGPGEKKLETDRRHIRSRISQLKRELEDIVRHRQVTREGRMRAGILRVAIAGYTNAGKSTLLNTLTGAGVLQEDKLFATLDPTTRKYTLASGQEILLTDTVGFIHKLPHHLVDAFKSTLEEARYADYIIHVVDASNPAAEEQMRIVYETLEQMDACSGKILTVFNKMDRARGDLALRDPKAARTVKASLLYGKGIEEIGRALEEMIRGDRLFISRTLPYTKAGLLQQIRVRGEIVQEEYREDGVLVMAYVPRDVYGRVMAEVPKDHFSREDS